jgi:hypothetical protein
MTTLNNIQPSKSQSRRRVAIVLLARLKRFLNGRVAATIARHERHATSSTLRPFDRRVFNEIENRHSPIDETLEDAARPCVRRPLLRT